MEGILLAFSIAIIIVAVGVMAMVFAQSDCADAAVSDNPPTWWKHALIDAKARAEKAKEK